jgi:hypothetical protein
LVLYVSDHMIHVKLSFVDGTELTPRGLIQSNVLIGGAKFKEMGT